MFLNITTHRTWIRSLKESDVKAIADIWGNQKVMAHCGGPIIGEHRLCRSIQYYQTIEEQSGISAYAVGLLNTDQLIGVCGFNPTHETDVIELIYHFKEEFWGKGFATEATNALIEYLRTHFDRKTVRMVRASIAPENTGSEKVLLKCGFSMVGEEWFEDTKRYEPVYTLLL